MTLTQHGADWPEGSLITQFGEIYRILKNFGDSGEVEYVDGELATNSFYWVYQEKKAELLVSGDDDALVQRAIQLIDAGKEKGSSLLQQWAQNQDVDNVEFATLSHVYHTTWHH